MLLLFFPDAATGTRTVRGPRAQSASGVKRLRVKTVRLIAAGRLRTMVTAAGLFAAAGRLRIGPLAFAAGRLPTIRTGFFVAGRLSHEVGRPSCAFALIRLRFECNGNAARAKLFTPWRVRVSHHGRHSDIGNVNLCVQFFGVH